MIDKQYHPHLVLFLGIILFFFMFNATTHEQLRQLQSVATDNQKLIVEIRTFIDTMDSRMDKEHRYVHEQFDRFSFQLESMQP